MTANRQIVLAGLVGLLWICPILGRFQTDRLRQCLESPDNQLRFVSDNYNGIIRKHLLEHGNSKINDCIIFLDKKDNQNDRKWNNLWPQIKNNSDSLFLLLSKYYIQKNIQMRFLYGKNCTADDMNIRCGNTCQSVVSESCNKRCLKTGEVCKKSIYSSTHCTASQVRDKYIINVTAAEPECINCHNPRKKPEIEIDLNKVMQETFNQTINTDSGNSLDPVAAVKVMGAAADLASSFNESSATLNLGEGVSGVLMKEPEPLAVDTVSFGYSSLNEAISVVDDVNYVKNFTQYVTVPKQAFQLARSLNVSVPFAVVMRFVSMSGISSNSTLLGNHVLAVEMGVQIKNLTDQISITFANMKYKGKPSCNSWNSEGNVPNWTDYGCETILTGDNVTCQCSHLTFFAILLAPHNETISSSDLNKLTLITQIGCGLSMFFLTVVLFMHFLLRKDNASTATIILIHLVCALFFLNFTFLINNFVAKMKSVVGCKIMAAVMHYFMLVTFTWFAVQAFHLSLQLYNRGQIQIRHYVRKVSIISWALPSIVGIVLLSVGKYGEHVINTENTEDNAVMCWIIDSDVHYIVNIGYYAVVFLFTFTAFIIIVSWLVCLKRSKAAGFTQVNKSSISMMTVLGLCCMMGITWGFAFFAHGLPHVPAYYIFTVLNSFQGFFLFIYYTSQSTEMNTSANNSQITRSTNILKTENPYENR